MKIATIALYLLAIVTANVVTASLAPIQLGYLIIPAGSFLIGATFIFRDLVQNAIGRKYTYGIIAAAMLLSVATSYYLGDTLWIVGASALTFLFSETTDTEIYTRLKLPMSLRVLYSGVVGGVVDSIVFVIIGLSPLGAGFLPWDMVGYAIAGQIIVKIVMQLIGSLIVQLVPSTRAASF
ncbi:VUT family protein [Cohnella cholangitidis]|uniref:VUT family protein n=1 Tax=Cohnella cholangitidis TaxID=2598458 RepID=A0A7G5C1J8_9BACL|nr:VUT family protein [Cohnella cholangitidis]QMV43082.1 VUT family protein [Cohnella cholangitidis]